MECTGKLVDISLDFLSGKYRLTFEINEQSALDEGYEEIKDCDKLAIKAVKFKNRRSLDANRLLWLCIGKIASELKVDAWEVYLKMLKRYGKFTYIVVKENAVDAVRAQWRETEIVGDITVNGQKAVQMLCYFGSSQLNTKEFSCLLDGVIDEMRQMGLQPPMGEEVKLALERYEKEWQKRNQS